MDRSGPEIWAHRLILSAISDVKFHVAGVFIYRVFALLVVFNSTVFLGRGRHYHPISSIFTVSVVLLKRFILSKFGYYSYGQTVTRNSTHLVILIIYIYITLLYLSLLVLSDTNNR